MADPVRVLADGAGVSLIPEVQELQDFAKVAGSSQVQQVSSSHTCMRSYAIVRVYVCDHAQLYVPTPLLAPEQALADDAVIPELRVILELHCMPCHALMSLWLYRHAKRGYARPGPADPSHRSSMQTRPLFLRTSGSSGVPKALCLKGMGNYPVTQKNKKK